LDLLRSSQVLHHFLVFTGRLLASPYTWLERADLSPEIVGASAVVIYFNPPVYARVPRRREVTVFNAKHHHSSTNL